MPSTVKVSPIEYATMGTEELIQQFTNLWQNVSTSFGSDDGTNDAIVAAMVSRLYGWSEISSGGSFK